MNKRHQRLHVDGTDINVASYSPVQSRADAFMDHRV